MLASSRRSAPIDSASAMRSATWSRFSRWSTTFSVSGSPSAFTQPATSQLPVERPEPGDRGRTPARVVSWIESCTLSSPSSRRSREPLAAQRDAAGDQVRVQVERPRARDELLEIVAHERLAAGQIHLDDAELLGLAAGRGATPSVSSSASMPRVVERVRAVRRSAAGSGRSARRSACTGGARASRAGSDGAAVPWRLTARPDQPAVGQGREERQHLALHDAPAADPCTCCAELLDDARDRVLARAQRGRRRRPCRSGRARAPG